jgi:hypothetical protein
LIRRPRRGAQRPDRPGAFEPNPKRRIDDGRVLLGDRELPVVDLIAAVLARVPRSGNARSAPARPTSP